MKAPTAKLDALTTSVSDRFESAESLNKLNSDALNQRFTDAKKLGLARHEALFQAIQSANVAANAKIDSLEKYLGLDHRMELLEARFGNPSQGQERRP